jgi:DNA-binding transcriptional LysR family regulator
MARENLNDLATFVVVAKVRSFTKAAAELGVSPSALSQTIRLLEERLGYRLLTRTTRSVSTTEAGERLLGVVAPRLHEIEAELEVLGELRERPAGSVRITCSEHAAETILWPKLRDGLPDYPDIKVELFIEHSFTDIAAERFDAGVRLGESVEKDMVAVRIGPDGRLVAVGSPSYFERHAPPTVPQDLVAHSCVNLRLATHGGLYAWEFEKDGRPLRVRVEGQLTFNTIRPMVEAALAGYGIAFVPEDSVVEHVRDGRLVQVLDEWCQPFAGFHLYYPSRRQNSSAFQTIVNLLRYRG